MASPSPPLSPSDDSPYNNTHRALLQAFLSRGTLTFPTAAPLLAAIHTAHDSHPTPTTTITPAHFAAAVSTLNTALSPFDLEIRSALPQRGNGERIWALVNTTSDAFAQLATTHSAEEVAWVKRALDFMFETANSARGGKEVLALSGMQAVKLARPPRASGRDAEAAAGGGGLTGAQAEGMLKRLTEEGWFEKAGKGHYTLSARGLMELRGWLLETYNEPAEEGEAGVQRVKLCHACRDIVTVGLRCKDRACLCRMHDHCAQGLFRAAREPRCPVCRVEWTGRDFVGVRALREADRAEGRGVVGAAREGEEDDNGAEEEATPARESTARASHRAVREVSRAATVESQSTVSIRRGPDMGSFEASDDEMEED